MSEYSSTKRSPKVAINTIRDDEDFLSEHLGSLLVRQPMSPKSSSSNPTHDLPIDFAKGPTSMRRHASQSQAQKSKSRKNEVQSPRRNASATHTANTVGVKTPEVTSPGCDDIFNSFFSTPKAAVTATERQSTIEGRSPFSLGISKPGPASVSMSTSFGRKQKPERRTISRTNSDRDSTATSFSSLSQQQQHDTTLSSRRASETTQPSNESGDLEQSSPETPPEGMLLAPISSCDEAEYDLESNSSSIPASSSASFGYEQYNPQNEKQAWQIFKEGGVIEPPEAIEDNTIERKDVQNTNLLPVQQRPRASLGAGSSQTSSRYTSMTSSRFQSYRSTLSSVPTEMDVHNESNNGEFVMDSRRSKVIAPQIEKVNKASSFSKQLAARSNSVTLVPSGDDGRTFVFVSRETDNDALSPIHALRRDGNTV